MEETELHVRSSGFVIYDKYCFLGGSPDGLVDDVGIIEVKCPYSKHLTPKEGVDHKKNKFCSIRDNKLTLKQSHEYFYQMQGLLEITKRKYCFFIIWTPLGLS